MPAPIAENHGMGILKRLFLVVLPGGDSDNFSHQMKVLYAQKFAERLRPSVSLPIKCYVWTHVKGLLSANRGRPEPSRADPKVALRIFATKKAPPWDPPAPPWSPLVGSEEAAGPFRIGNDV